MDFKKRLAQISRFLISGGIGVGLYYATFIGLSYLGAHWFIASLPAFMLNTTVNYLLQKHWTFKNKETKKIKKQIITYWLMSIGLLVGNTIFMFIGVELLKQPELTSQICTSLLLSIISYFITKLIFKNPEP